MNTISLVDVKEETYEDRLLWAFPKITPPYKPYGGRVMVQLRRVSTKTRGGIQLTSDAIDTEQCNTQVGILIAAGPLAFKNKSTMEPWPENIWAIVGDFVRTPKFGGDRVAVEVPDTDDTVIFATFNDHELIGLIDTDPLAIKAYV